MESQEGRLIGGGIAAKLSEVRPLAATIMDKTVGRYQSIQGDVKFVHEFIHICTEEIQSLLVGFHESVVMEERRRAAAFAGEEPQGGVQQGAFVSNDRLDSNGVGRIRRPLLPASLYTATDDESEHAEQALLDQGAVTRDELRHQKAQSKHASIEAQISRILSDASARPAEDAEGLTEHKAPPRVDVSDANALDRQRVADLINQLDSLRAELDVSQSDQHFLRSIASDILRDLEGKDAEISTLKGALSRREGLINEQRRAYIGEMSHLREMLRQYRERGKCDLADATLYTWDANAVQRFQEEEVRSKIEAAVLEAKRGAQLERDALEAHFKKQTDDLRRKVAALSEGVTSGVNLGASSRLDYVFEPLDAALSPSPPQARALSEVPSPPFTNRLNGTSVSLRGNSLGIHDTVTVEEVSHWEGASIASAGGSVQIDSPGAGAESSLWPAPEVATNGGARRPTQPLLPASEPARDSGALQPLGSPTNAHSVNYSRARLSQYDDGSVGRIPSPAAVAELQAFEEGRSALAPLNRSAEAATADSHNLIPLPLSESPPAIDSGTLHSVSRDDPAGHSTPGMAGRLRNRDAMIGRLSLIIRTLGTAEAQSELSLIEEAHTLTQKQEALEDALMGVQSSSNLSSDANNSSFTLQYRNLVTSPISISKGSASPIGNTDSTPPVRSKNSNGRVGRGAKHSVAFGLSTRPSNGPASDGVASGESALDLHRQIFGLQKQLAKITVGFEQLCLKSKVWYTAYKELGAQSAMGAERAVAERNLRRAVLIAEAAEERYRIHGWKVMRTAASYRLCLSNQRQELKDAEASASHRTQLLLGRQLDVLDRTLSRKLLWLRQQHVDMRDEANEGWDLVLIHAKAVARLVVAANTEVDASSLRKVASHSNVPDDVTERQLNLHSEACAQRRQYSSQAQHRLLEKYAVANVVRRYVGSTHSRPIPPFSDRLSDVPGVSSCADSLPNPRPISVLSRPPSAVERGEHAKQLGNTSESMPDVAQSPNSVDEVTSGVSQLDPRCYRELVAEQDRIKRIQVQARARSMRGIGVVERLVQKRIDTGVGSADRGSDVLSGQGYAQTIVETPLRAKVPDGEGEKVSCAGENQRSDAVSTVHTPLPTASMLRPRPASASSHAKPQSRPLTAQRTSKVQVPASTCEFNVSTFKELRPDQRRAELVSMLRHDRSIQESERRGAIGAAYALRNAAVVARGGAGPLAGQNGLSATLRKLPPKGTGRPASANYAYSRGHNTGAPSAEPFVFATVGTFTTEDEIHAGIHRTKIIGKNERAARER